MLGVINTGKPKPKLEIFLPKEVISVGSNNEPARVSALSVPFFFYKPTLIRPVILKPFYLLNWH